VKLIVPRKLSGIGKSALVDDEQITFGEDFDDVEAWHFGPNTYHSIARVAEAQGNPIEYLPKDPRMSWWSTWSTDIRVDHVLGKKSAIDNLKRLIDLSRRVYESEPYFVSQYQTQNRLLDLLQPAFVDKNELPDDLDISGQGLEHDSKGMCNRVLYDNFSTSTGRMSVKSGPKILTLNKDLHRIFTSRWGPAGTLLSIDYNALEPRVIMTIMGDKDLPSDIYTDIGKKSGILNTTRDNLKLMILSVLYGMSRKNFIVKFMSESDPDVAYDNLHRVLGVKIIMEKVRSESNRGRIRNHFGRPLSCDNPSLYVNHFTQSTAVDVACDGFLDFIGRCGDTMVPVFIRHDELVIDVHNENVDKVMNLAQEGLFIPSLNTKFHTKVKVFNARKDHQ
jgi:hypothetical protein